MQVDQSINSESEFKKADLKIKKLDVIIKGISALLVSITIAFTYAQYRYTIEKENRERTANQAKDRETALRESLKPFLEKQMQLYVEASSVTAKLATLQGGTPREEARQRFWQLYWGELSLVESREVESAMVQFGEILEEYERKEADISELKDKSLSLANACRESLSKIGGYDLPVLNRDK